MFKPIKDLIGISINRAGLNGEVKALAVISEYKKFTNEIMGDDAAKNLIPKFFKEGNLYIEAKSSGWSQNLHMKQHQLIVNINEALNEDIVKRFIIKIVG